MYKYKTSGTCSREIYFTIDDNNIITHLEIVGGCTGNTKGIEKLCVGRDAMEVSKLLSGIQCQGNTSCPDQLSKAINLYYQEKKDKA